MDKFKYIPINPVTPVVEEESVEQIFNDDVREKKIIGYSSRRRGTAAGRLGDLRVGHSYGDRAVKERATFNIDDIVAEVAKGTTVLSDVIREKMRNDQEFFNASIEATLQGLNEVVAVAVKANLIAIEQHIYSNVDQMIRTVVEERVHKAVQEAFQGIQLSITPSIQAVKPMTASSVTRTTKEAPSVKEDKVTRAAPSVKEDKVTKSALNVNFSGKPKKTIAGASAGRYLVQAKSLKKTTLAPTARIFSMADLQSRKNLRTFTKEERMILKMQLTLQDLEPGEIDTITSTYAAVRARGKSLRSSIYSPTSRLWSGWHDFYTDLVAFKNREGRWADVVVTD